MKTVIFAFVAAIAAELRATMEFATPESQGIPSGAILEWIDACEKTFDGGKSGALHGFVLVRHGKVVAEGSWKPFDTLNETHMLYSHSKSFTSTAVGLLVDEGKVDLDERVVDIFTNERPAVVSKNLAQLRVRDLLTMNAGKKDHLLRHGGHWVKSFLSQDFTREPGTFFKYDSDATYMLAALVERRAGMKTMDYLKAKMFDKIGISKAWTTCSPQGVACGGWGMNMTTRELARFGQLYLQKGVWNGEQILSPDWVSLATTRQTWCNGITIQSQTIGSGSDWKQGYGFQFWRCRHGAYRADGAAGQLTVVMPNEDAVVSVHAGLGDMQGELNLIWNHLLPAMLKDPLPENPEAQKKLAARCAGLAIAPLAGGAETPAAILGRDIALVDPAYNFESVRLDRADDGWNCTLVTPSGRQTIPVGCGVWRKGKMRIDAHDYESLGDYIGEHATAASGGVDANGVFRMKAYLPNDTNHIDLELHAEGEKVVVDGRFWGMGGGRFQSAPERKLAPLPVGRVPFADGAAVEDKAYGPVRYWQEDALPVPARPTRNILFNGSFEQGLAGWCYAFPFSADYRRYVSCVNNGGTCYEEIVTEAKFGRKAVHFRALKPGSVRDDVRSETLSVYTNRPYVASFWAKAAPGERPSLAFGVETPVQKTDHGKGVVGRITDLDGNRLAPLRPALDGTWRRFEVPFKSNVPGVWLAISAEGVLMDGVSVREKVIEAVEKPGRDGVPSPSAAGGGTPALPRSRVFATASIDNSEEVVGGDEDDPLVAHLVTADPDNNLTDADSKRAKVEVSRQFGGEEVSGGTLRVRVLNYYYETVIDRTYALAPSAGEAYPLDLAPAGEGVFVVRYDFALPDGRAWTDYERFGVLTPLAADVPVSKFFLNYAFFMSAASRCADTVPWMEARGIRATSWPEVTSRANPQIAALYANGRFRSGVHVFSHDLKTRYPDRFGWKDGVQVLGFANLSTNITAETLAFIEKEAYRSGMAAADGDDLWCLDYEEECGLPCIRERLDFEGWFKMVAACYRGLKKAFDERGRTLRFAPTHGPCNFNATAPHEVGKAYDRRNNYDRMLELAEINGLRYDVLPVHMYWALDGSIVQRWRRNIVPTLYDRNENAEALVALAAKRGYGSETPLRFEEGFDILPFYVPEFGSEGFGDFYYGTYTSRAYGNTEFVHAGAIARQYLMDLRYWPRLETSHIWQHRTTMDLAMSPWMWTKVSNTIGRLLPDPQFVGCQRLTPVSRAYVFRQGKGGVMTLWTHDNDVELGKKPGEVVRLRLPADARFYDLMGNERTAKKEPDGRTALPLTPAPLFVTSSDVDALAEILK